MPEPARNRKTIVCALDLLPAARMEAGWAAFLAQHLGAALTLFNAINIPSDQLHPTAEFERGGLFQHRRDQNLKEIRQIMQDQHTEVAWNVHIVQGDPAESLQHFCRSHPVDLVIAGSRGIKGFKRLLLGTVVERLAHVSACPLLIIRNPQRPIGEIKKIGICCDLKADNALLLQWGQDLAGILNARVCLLHAMESPVQEAIVDPTAAPYSQVQQMLQERLAARLLAIFSCASTHRPLLVSAHIVHGSIKNSLLGLVRALPIDLLIVGVHHHRTFEKLVIGSTTNAVLRRAACNVLTVPIPLLADSKSAGSSPDRGY